MRPYKYTHDDFKEMKQDLKLTNADIAEIIGELTPDSVKTLTQPNRDLPKWVRSMLYVWKLHKTND